MTLLTTLARTAGFVRGLVGSAPEETDTLGPGAIAAARRELTENDQPTAATVGEPRLGDYSGDFTTDVKAVVPLHTPKYEDPAPMTFDVDGDDLAEFCAAYDVEVEHIGALEGATLPLQWKQGAPVPDWKALESEEI